MPGRNIAEKMQISNFLRMKLSQILLKGFAEKDIDIDYKFVLGSY